MAVNPNFVLSLSVEKLLTHSFKWVGVPTLYQIQDDFISSHLHWREDWRRGKATPWFFPEFDSCKRKFHFKQTSSRNSFSVDNKIVSMTICWFIPTLSVEFPHNTYLVVVVFLRTKRILWNAFSNKRQNFSFEAFLLKNRASWSDIIVRAIQTQKDYVKRHLKVFSPYIFEN